MVSVNEVQTEKSMPFIAASVEQCRIPAARYITTREKWYQKHSLTEGYDKNNGQRAPAKYDVGDEVLAIEAVENQLEDVRPKVYDSQSKECVLLDSGSCVSCEPKQPGDVIDPSFKLRAVNGHSIPTFGTKKIEIRI